MMSFAGGGVRLMVPGEDAAYASEILQAAPYEGEGLVEEAGAHPFEEMEPEGDGVALWLLVTLVLLIASGGGALAARAARRNLPKE